MSGIDDYTRFYWTVDNASLGMNDAWLSQAYFDVNTATWYSLNPNTGLYDLPGNHDDYPHLSIGQTYTDYTYPSGKFDLGFQVVSYDPTLVPTRPRTYWQGYDKVSYNSVKGLYACLDQDYTIDFWFKLNSGASGKQPIFSCNNLSWEIYYQDGFIHQKQGLNNQISCEVNFSDLGFHHIELNRSLGINRIFVDGRLKVLSTNTWFVTMDVLISSLIDSGYFYIGCPTNTYRNVDYVVDEVRFCTGIARHDENSLITVPGEGTVVGFDLPIGHYTRPAFITKINSPTDAVILLDCVSSFLFEIENSDIKIPAIQNGIIHFGESISLGLEVYRYPFSFPLTMNLNYEELLSLEIVCIGLTVPPITDGEIIFDSELTTELVVEIGNIINILTQGTIYRLINNAIQIPTDFSVVVELNRGTAGVPTYSFSFLNKLLSDFSKEFSFVNGLNFDYESQFSFKNRLTVKIELSFDLPNKVLLKNELDKDFVFANRLLDESVFESYTTFYFSERHGL